MVSIYGFLLIIYVVSFTQETCIRTDSLSSCSFEDFTSTPCPEKLIISSATFKVLSKTDLAGCENTNYLNIRNSLSGIQDDAFGNMEKLARLIFDHNVLPTVNRNWFNGLTKLTLLSMTNCSIEDIEIGAFSMLDKLQKLWIKENNLTVIKYGIFNQLNLEALALSENSISRLEDDCFTDLISLKRLHLDQNELPKFVAKDVLGGSMDNLEILWLHKNLLKQLSSVMLEGLNKLRVLNVGYNQISIIEPSTFENTPNLETLILKDNHLTYLDSTVFPEKGLKKLQMLYIDNNRFTYLKSGLLHKLSKLKSIAIGGNPWQCKCFDIILIWIGENRISNKCDQEYLDGNRPYCVVSVYPANECVYMDDSSYFIKYAQEMESYPELPFCF